MFFLNSYGQIIFIHDILDIPIQLEDENTREYGWQENISCYIFDTGQHVLAANLNVNIALPNLKSALAGSNLDRKIWDTSYDKEYDGLNGLNLFTEITVEQYREYC